jgi:predicted DNA-binding WGR domain protein
METIDTGHLERYKTIWLRCIDPVENHNKEYVLDRTLPDDGTFTSLWGRIGAKPQKMVYGNAQFDKKFKEKIKKGYEVFKFVEIENYKDELAQYFEEAGWDEFELD